MALLGKLDGYKTYLGAIGLLALAIFQFATGNIPMGFHSLFLAITSSGLRAAIAKIQP